MITDRGVAAEGRVRAQLTRPPRTRGSVSGSLGDDLLPHLPFPEMSFGCIVNGRDEMLNLIERIGRDFGITVIVASHELERAGALATRVATVVNGEVQ